MIVSHKIRLNPTKAQESLFRQACGIKRLAFNWGLAEWKRQKEIGNPSCGALTLKKMFRKIHKTQFPFVFDAPSCVIDGAFANLASAFKKYFDAKKSGSDVGFPKFKGKHDTRQSFYLANSRFAIDGHTLKISMLGDVNMAEVLRFNGKIMSATISSKADRWHASIAVECDDLQHVHKLSSVGVDVGIKSMATLSDGREFANFKPLATMERKLSRLSRELSRRKQGSGHWLRTKSKIAKLHDRIDNMRKHTTHAASLAISQSAQVVCVEDLHVKGMMKNSHLAKAAADANMGELLRQIEYKTKMRGGELVKVGRFYASSKTCNHCGNVNKNLTLSERVWYCVACGAQNARDFNAAQNIESEGLRIRAAGKRDAR